MLYQLLDLLRYQERQNYLSDNNRISSSVWFGSHDSEQIDENTLPIRERIILRKISVPVKENNVWKIRTNQKLVDLHTELDIISEFRKVTRVRTCGKSARRNECEESV